MSMNWFVDIEGDTLVAQSFAFFFAGFETSSSTMMFALYELAKRPDVQSRLRMEMQKVLGKHGHEVTYEAIQEMDYLHMVISGEYLQPLPSYNKYMHTYVNTCKVGSLRTPFWQFSANLLLWEWFKNGYKSVGNTIFVQIFTFVHSVLSLYLYMSIPIIPRGFMIKSDSSTFAVSVFILSRLSRRWS